MNPLPPWAVPMSPPPTSMRTSSAFSTTSSTSSTTPSVNSPILFSASSSSPSSIELLCAGPEFSPLSSFSLTGSKPSLKVSPLFPPTPSVNLSLDRSIEHLSPSSQFRGASLFPPAPASLYHLPGSSTPASAFSPPNSSSFSPGGCRPPLSSIRSGAPIHIGGFRLASNHERTTTSALPPPSPLPYSITRSPTSSQLFRHASQMSTEPLKSTVSSPDIRPTTQTHTLHHVQTLQRQNTQYDSTTHPSFSSHPSVSSHRPSSPPLPTSVSHDSPPLLLSPSLHSALRPVPSSSFSSSSTNSGPPLNPALRLPSVLSPSPLDLSSSPPPSSSTAASSTPTSPRSPSFSSSSSSSPRVSCASSVCQNCCARPRGYVPSNPYKLNRFVKVVLHFTELPFLILWVYFVYFVVIVVLTASRSRELIWLNALVAGFLVGMGLNANAYNAIMYRGTLDIGMVVRFFLIPFGVSALSAITNSLRDDFMLVFPKDAAELCIAIATPASVVTLLVVMRLLLLWSWRLPVTLRNLLLNGRLYR